ncbi:hypothetical protein [Treponema sp.]|uniref:hypothetical protein n=1 Tax=Treponema sp. TaxID=166 RepID=UPI003F00D03B
MEIKRRIFLCALLLLSAAVFCQVPQQSTQIRIQVWAELDSFPGKFEEEENSDAEPDKKKPDTEFERLYGFALSRTKQIAPFLMEGLLYGWNFEYTPYDKKRGVQEYWDFQPVRTFDSSVNQLEFHNPVLKDGKLLSWVYCNRTLAQQADYNRWISVIHPKVKGYGNAPVEDGFEGIRQACSSAAKNAVREYWRTLEKNKPKEISGTLLLIRDPRIFIKNGRYEVELDFFLETDRIVPYTYY